MRVRVLGSARGWHSLTPARFDEMWSLHPPNLGRNTFDGRSVQTPRYFQAFGRAYSFSGQTAAPLPLARVPLAAEPLTKIAALVTAAGAGTAQPPLPSPNGLLVNWYRAEHSIGLHRDDTRELVHGAPVWSLSWGHRRRFCLRPRVKSPRYAAPIFPRLWPYGFRCCLGQEDTGQATGSDSSGSVSLELELGDGDLLVMGGRCQMTHKHEVPRLPRHELPGEEDEERQREMRRINLTFRSFA